MKNVRELAERFISLLLDDFFRWFWGKDYFNMAVKMADIIKKENEVNKGAWILTRVKWRRKHLAEERKKQYSENPGLIYNEVLYTWMKRWSRQR